MDIALRWTSVSRCCSPKLQRLVFGEDVGGAALEVLLPLVDSHHHGEELLVCGELLVPHPQGLAEVCHRVAVLDEDDADASVASIGLDSEGALEVGQGEHGRGDHGRL